MTTARRASPRPKPTPPRQPAPAAPKAARSVLGLQGVNPEQLREWLAAARDLRRAGVRGTELAGRVVANLFFEDSTRTRTAFSVAAARLGARVVDVTGPSSSVNKGETLDDTARNVASMGVDLIVIRARQAGAPHGAARAVACPVINAGDGRHEHPTQGLLDVYTLAAAHDRLSTFDLRGLTLAIVGDVASSRVARSAIAGATALGAKVVCVGPAGFVGPGLAALGSQVSVSGSLDEVLPRADAVMMLRIQFERQGEGRAPGPASSEAPKGGPLASVREYRAGYALTPERTARLKAGAVVMHPGPINRGIELDTGVADGPRSVIMQQVEHGVWVRMALLRWCLGV